MEPAATLPSPFDGGPAAGCRSGRACAGHWTTAGGGGHASPVTNVQQIYDDGLCMQCGTCAALCPAEAIGMAWDMRVGYRLRVDDRLCTDCGACRTVCPGPGLDFTAGAWWRTRNEGAPSRDYLGPWRALWFGWAADPAVRRAGASGGVATALLAGALEQGLVDTVIAVGTRPANPLEAVGVMCRTTAEVAA